MRTSRFTLSPTLPSIARAPAAGEERAGERGVRAAPSRWCVDGVSVGFAPPRTGDLLGRAAGPSRAAALACTRAGEGDLEARRWRLSAEWTISRFTSRARRPWDYD